MLIEVPKVKEAFLKKIEKIVGPLGYSSKNLDRLNYARDSSFKATIQMKYAKVEHFPDVIAWPRSVDEVQKLVKLAVAFKMPVVPFGAGSGVCGGTIPVKGGMIIDVKKMNRLITLDTENLVVEAESGIMSMGLEDQLERRGYTLGHFPSSIICASLGGCLAARSAGQLSSRYGKIEDMVLNLEMVTGSGEVVSTRNVNNSSGFDLNQLFIGSEGTLGIITKASLRIFPQPRTRAFRSVSFKDMPTSIEAIRRFMQLGVKPAVVRLYDELDTLLLVSSKSTGGKIREHGWSDKIKEMIKFSGLKAMLHSPRLLNASGKFFSRQCAVIFMFEGHEAIVREEKEMVMDLCLEMGAQDLGEKPARHWYENRYRVSYNASPLFHTGHFTDTIEVAASWDRVPLLYEKMVQAISPHAMIMAHLSHVYTDGGALYFTFVAPLRGLKSGEKMYDLIWEKAMKTCLGAGGTISHHHGIGRLKAKYMTDEWGEGLALYKELKNYYDPHHLMNPGKLM